MVRFPDDAHMRAISSEQVPGHGGPADTIAGNSESRDVEVKVTDAGEAFFQPVARRDRALENMSADASGGENPPY
jgi:hypothetical protein